MSSTIDIPSYPKNNINVNGIEVEHGKYIHINLSLKHRKDCFEAVRFLTEIIDEMIDHSTREKE